MSLKDRKKVPLCFIFSRTGGSTRAGVDAKPRLTCGALTPSVAPDY